MRDRRTLVWVALLLGALESVNLLHDAGRNNPSAFVAVAFTAWVLAPFAVLAWANIASLRWSPAMHTLVHIVTVAVSFITIALYARVIPMPTGSPNTFVFVATPPLTMVVFAFVAAVARTVRAAR